MGGNIRIAMTRKPFKKVFTGQWSDKLFVVAKKLRTIPTTYRLKDLVDKPIERTLLPSGNATGMNGTIQGLHGGTCVK